jgi:hypothetical protein
LRRTFAFPISHKLLVFPLDSEQRTDMLVDNVFGTIPKQHDLLNPEPDLYLRRPTLPRCRHDLCA